jgi:GMP synthase (glutamine-hydrolysing)
VPFEEFNMKVVEELNPRAVAISGFSNNIEDFEIGQLLGLDEVLHNADIPIIGFCGGHQLIGFSFNQNLREAGLLKDQCIKRLERPDDGPCISVKGFDYYYANGFFHVTRLKEDPLFADLPETMIMPCYHCCEIKKLPENFELLASTAHCRIETIKHVSRPLYGTQFHPEAFEDPYFDGRKLLENFAKITERFWSNR